MVVFAAILALSVLIGALVILVAVAISKQNSESSEENEQNKDADSTSKWTRSRKVVFVSIKFIHKMFV